jgi:ATP-dependent DNA ligase
MAKRLNAPYAEGRRSSAWIKRKNRRSERFVVRGGRERPGVLPEFFLARRRDGKLAPAGSASLGLNAERRAALIAALTECEIRRRAGAVVFSGRRRS